ncbi:MAG: hypothetical protein J6W86_02140 [Bacteroidales bacterium]|nr:hypothetical protein [Bacteroidales bacterium]
MKVKEVPQDLKYYKGSVVRDLNYAVDENGQYKAVVSDGWTPKNDALDMALDEIKMQCCQIAEKVRKGESSPLEYHAAKNMLSVRLLAEYTGIPKRKIRRHFKPENFAALDEKTLAVYADALRITVEELKNIPE